MGHRVGADVAEAGLAAGALDLGPQRRGRARASVIMTALPGAPRSSIAGIAASRRTSKAGESTSPSGGSESLSSASTSAVRGPNSPSAA